MTKYKNDKPKILVIDDDESNRVSFYNSLTKEGYEVVTAGDYEEALARINETDFDLIFADFRLGTRSGLDVLHEINYRNLLVPVIIMTKAPNARSAQESFQLGAIGHVSKPLSEEKVVHLTRLVLRNGCNDV